MEYDFLRKHLQILAKTCNKIRENHQRDIVLICHQTLRTWVEATKPLRPRLDLYWAFSIETKYGPA